jgi:hypothetical protein
MKESKEARWAPMKPQGASKREGGWFGVVAHRSQASSLADVVVMGSDAAILSRSR